MAETLDATTTTDLVYDSTSWWKRPDAKDDTANTNEDTPVTINVLTNDVGAVGIVKVNGTAVTADTPPVTLTSGATVDLEGKTLLYDPGQAFQGLNSEESKTDTFSYTVAGKYKSTDTANVTVKIAGVTDDDPTTNDAPVANDDTAYLPSYYPYPLPYEQTVDSTTATTTDASLSDAPIMTTLAIGEEGDPDPYPSSVDINVLANDTDADGNPLKVAAIAGTKVDTDPNTDLPNTVTLEKSGATVTLNGNGSLIYTEKQYVGIEPVPLPEQDATLTASSDGSAELLPYPYPEPVDSFTYTASDGTLTDDATVSIYQSPIYYLDAGTDPVLETSTDVGDPGLLTV